MQLYEMQVNKTAIYRTAPARIPMGIIGAAVKLRFSPEWEGLTKTVVFRAGEVVKDILEVEDVAVIPAECTQEAGALLEIGVYGVDGENTVAIPTLWAAIGRVTEAADPSGDATTDPQLPVWAQLQAQIDELERQGVTQNEIEQAVRDFFGGERPTGKTTPEGGEVFNDYEGNQALAPYAKADGAGNRAGIRGYKLLAVEKDGEGYNITVSDAALESKAIDNYAAGDILCFDGTNHYYDVLKIVTVTENADGNSVIQVIAAEGKTMPTLAVDSSKNEWENWVYVLKKPYAGEPVKAARGAHAGGVGNTAIGYGAVALGMDNQAVGKAAFAAGRQNVVHYAGFALGHKNAVTGENATAQGYSNTASGNSAHAEGTSTTASGNYAHSEGSQTVASGLKSHAEGDKTKATGDYAHAEGASTTASGVKSHSEGASTTASGDNSHAEGRKTVAKGVQSHAEGNETIAAGTNQHVQGKFNVEDASKAHIVGGGTSDTKRKNIHTIDWDGNAEFAGKVYAEGKELAKLAEVTPASHATDKNNPHSVTIGQIGAAPDGFGLGVSTGHLKVVTKEELDATLTAGLYEYYNADVKCCGYDGTNYGSILVIPAMWGCTQFFFCRNAATVQWGGYLKRCYISKADSGKLDEAGNKVAYWKPWEWVNPPMHAGVEYRTTERWRGSPVYAKVLAVDVDIDTDLLRILEIPHGIENFDHLVRCVAQKDGVVLPWHKGSIHVQVSEVNSTRIQMQAVVNSSGSEFTFSGITYFTLYYTKA